MKYRSKEFIECRPYVEGESVRGVSIGGLDRQMGHPKVGDMLVWQPDNPGYVWLMTSDYLNKHYEPVEPN